MANFRYELRQPEHLKDGDWEEGFESYEDAYEAMTERMTELVNEIAELHPEMSDKEIEDTIDWEITEA